MSRPPCGHDGLCHTFASLQALCIKSVLQLSFRFKMSELGRLWAVWFKVLREEAGVLEHVQLELLDRYVLFESCETAVWIAENDSKHWRR